MHIYYKHLNYHDFNLGFTTKARAWKGVGRECNPGAHTFSSGLPLW